MSELGSVFTQTSVEAQVWDRTLLRVKFLILAISPAEKVGDTSLLICLTLQAIMMVLSTKILKYQSIKSSWAAHECIKKTFNGSPECTWSESTFLAGQAAVSPNNLHAVSRFDHVHQVVVQDDVYRAGQLTGWGLLWHLLHGDGLVVLIDRETKLCLQGVVLFILLRDMGTILILNPYNCPFRYSTLWEKRKTICRKQ